MDLGTSTSPWLSCRSAAVTCRQTHAPHTHCQDTHSFVDVRLIAYNKHPDNNMGTRPAWTVRMLHHSGFSSPAPPSHTRVPRGGRVQGSAKHSALSPTSRVPHAQRGARQGKATCTSLYACKRSCGPLQQQLNKCRAGPLENVHKRARASLQGTPPTGRRMWAASGVAVGFRPTPDRDADRAPVDLLTASTPREGREVKCVEGRPGPLGAPVTWYVAAPRVWMS